MLDRKSEADFYTRVYRDPRYSMRDARRAATIADLAALPSRGAYLDVACGRREMLAAATRLGFDPVMGTEVVPELIDGREVVHAEAHALPFLDGAFSVVTLFDVIEHLVPGDDELACRELARIAGRHVLITASNKPSVWCGRDLHINKRPYEEWDRLFKGWFSGCVVTWLRPTPRGASQRWRVDL